ncbi:MAG: glycosyl hydrolase 53 family protein [Phaeodactylibacter sp.]|nr:glycosyl hydrolase 53 family protein [Phaeodactylibacter sp.]
MPVLRILFLLSFLAACTPEGAPTPPDGTPPPGDSLFYRGADLSYLNEMEDCGAIYRDAEGTAQDPYQLFATAGANLVRVRLWYQADWTDYSNLEDVQKTIARAKAAGMQVLLDFHNSDNWADPQRQHIPAAWLQVVEDRQALGDSLHQYIYGVLQHLHTLDLLPEIVQMGNEINAEILQDPNGSYSQIDWSRNAYLINRGLAAIRQAATDLDAEIQSMLHIAQPENALWWFEEAAAAGVTDFDWIGISYYPKWSEYDFNTVPTPLKTLRQQYGKPLMIVETAYPYTMENQDPANNILGTDALLPGYPATEQGQLDYLLDLKEVLHLAGAQGLIYWEPAWVSTDCSTLWGQGSHWDNATLFGSDGRALKGMEFYQD